MSSVFLDFITRKACGTNAKVVPTAPSNPIIVCHSILNVLVIDAEDFNVANFR